jgi:hypothetical protein
MLELPALPDVHGLDHLSTKEEVKRALLELPAERAPGPDGFTGAFYHQWWDIVRHEIMTAFNSFYNLMIAPLMKLNSALITLLPKKEVSEVLWDFKPISLIHSFAKLVTKVLASQLSRCIDQLVSQAQSAFIKQRCIQDNFLYVRNLARTYYRKKTPALLFKLDISRAFDSVSWEYLL